MARDTSLFDRRTMTADDRNELFAAMVERFRSGEFGPMTFRAKARELGVSDDEISTARDLHIDACARNMRA